MIPCQVLIFTMSFNNELYGVGFEVEKLGGVSCVVR